MGKSPPPASPPRPISPASSSSYSSSASSSSQLPRSASASEAANSKRGGARRTGGRSGLLWPSGSGKRSSAYRGVTKHRWTGRYEAHLWDKEAWNPITKKKGRQVYLGAYDDEEAAAHTYDLAALKHWGPSAILNFPLNAYAQDFMEMQAMSKEEYLASLRRRSSGFSRGVSKYRGVARHHRNGRWEARIGRVLGNKYLYLGTFNFASKKIKHADPSFDYISVLERVSKCQLFSTKCPTWSSMSRWAPPRALSHPSKCRTWVGETCMALHNSLQQGEVGARVLHPTREQVHPGTQEEAARAYDRAALEYRGPNAVTNFGISCYLGDEEKALQLPTRRQLQHLQEFQQLQQQEIQLQYPLPNPQAQRTSARGAANITFPKQYDVPPGVPEMQEPQNPVDLEAVGDHPWTLPMEPEMETYPTPVATLGTYNCLDGLVGDTAFEDNIECFFQDGGSGEGGRDDSGKEGAGGCSVDSSGAASGHTGGEGVSGKPSAEEVDLPGELGGGAGGAVGAGEQDLFPPPSMSSSSYHVPITICS